MGKQEAPPPRPSGAVPLPGRPAPNQVGEVQSSGRPLTPDDCDLRDSKFMPMYVQALLNSGFNAMLDDTAWRAGVTLWLKAWHQVPAASLPAGDEDLCALAGFGRALKRWQKVRDKALRGWVLCDDGRLYHPLIAEAALEAWISRLLGQVNSAAGNARRWNVDFDPTPWESQINEAAPLLRALNPQAEAIKKLDRRKAPIGMRVGSQGEAEGEGKAEDSLKESGFEAFRDAYPAAHGAASAEKAWVAALAEGHDPAAILSGLDAAKAQWRKDKTPPRFIPLAGNWLDRRAWLNFAPAPSARTWSGPPALRAAVVAELGAEGEAFARSYLDPSGWEAPSTLIARTAVAAGKLSTVDTLRSCRILLRK
jgi:hypothetical protein